MNKNTKIWLKYLPGAAISCVLLITIYRQVVRQAGAMQVHSWRQPVNGYLWLCIGLMLANTLLEAARWRLALRSTVAVPFARAYASYLAGVAVSVVTPNRVGEYPARVLYLHRAQVLRFLPAIFTAVFGQLLTVYLFGLPALIYYNISAGTVVARAGLAYCVLGIATLLLLYYRSHRLVGWLGRYKRLRRLVTYSKLLNRRSRQGAGPVLALSCMRFALFTAQYLFLLKWMNVNVPPAEGYLLSVLFFWVIAVVPSIALTELGFRGYLALLLFGSYSANSAGILIATFALWMLNLVIPAITGSLMLLRLKPERNADTPPQ